MRYSVFETLPFGAFIKAGEVDAVSDAEALKRARNILSAGAGELRQDTRIVCRFGRTEPFILRS
jgi:hypothetical protein